MNSIPLAVWTFLYRAWYYASIGYLCVSVFILRPTNWFGLAHCVWACVCIYGTRQLLKKALAKEAAQSREGS